MDMEKLTKQQIVLVTLLVSFVTSIATGIVTVALMDQAPPGVTQTINRVVERTVERVVTPPTTGNSAAVITRETVVVKEDDKIVESVDKNKVSVVRIYTDTRREEDRVFVGLGTIVNKEGLIATGEVFGDTRAKYVVTTNGTSFYPVTVLPKKDANTLYFLKVVQDDKSPISFVPVVLSDSNNLKLGQTIIAWGGDTRNAVSTGIISSLIDTEVTVASSSTSTLPVREIIGLMTNNNLSDSIAGGPLLSLYGETVGIRVSANISDKFTFLPANILKQEIAGL
jgi:S1-C subfamily serine protease